jgi:hypothetical protein
MTSTGKRHRNSALPNATGDDHDVYAGKLQACRFFFAEEEVDTHDSRSNRGCPDCFS